MRCLSWMTIMLSEQSFVLFLKKAAAFDNCVEAANAFEALNKTKQFNAGLSPLWPFSIPDMNGLQLAHQLKAREPALPIFMLTADNDVNIEKEALAFGITAVFPN